MPSLRAPVYDTCVPTFHKYSNTSKGVRAERRVESDGFGVIAYQLWPLFIFRVKVMGSKLKEEGEASPADSQAGTERTII